MDQRVFLAGKTIDGSAEKWLLQLTSLPCKFYLKATEVSIKRLFISFSIYLFRYKPQKQTNYNSIFFFVRLTLNPSFMGDALILSARPGKAFELPIIKMASWWVLQSSCWTNYLVPAPTLIVGRTCQKGFGRFEAKRWKECSITQPNERGEWFQIKEARKTTRGLMNLWTNERH